MKVSCGYSLVDTLPRDKFVHVCSHVPQDSKFLKGVNRISLRAPWGSEYLARHRWEKKKKDKENHV